MGFIKRFVDDDSGATAIEYGFIALMIGVAIIPALILLAPKLIDTFNTISGMF